MHFGDLITKAIQYKMVPKRPETRSGCYKSQSFFFPKTSRNPTQPGNPKLNYTSSTPENKVQIDSTEISKDPVASKSHQNALEKVLVDLKVSPNVPGLLQLNALQGCTPPSLAAQRKQSLNLPTPHVQSRLCDFQRKIHSIAFPEVLVNTKLSP